MTVSRRTTAVTAAALSAMLALAACNGAEPVVGPTGSSSSTPSKTTTAPPTTTTISKATTTTPTPTVDPVLAKIPKAARPETIEGAEAYVMFYINTINRAFRTGDSSDLEELTAKECATCASLIGGVQEMNQKNRKYGGDLARVAEASTTKFTKTDKRLLLQLNQNSTAILDSSGREVARTNKAEVAYVVTLSYGSRWAITRMQKVGN